MTTNIVLKFGLKATYFCDIFDIICTWSHNCCKQLFSLKKINSWQLYAFELTPKYPKKYITPEIAYFLKYLI